MQEFFFATMTGFEKVVFLVSIGLALEYLLPADKDQPASSIIFNIVWIAFYLAMTNLLMLFMGKYIQIGINALGGPLIKIDFPIGIWGWVMQFMVFALIHDFCYYWFHRSQHTWRWFWAHHKFHHTDVHMNASTSFRHHWLENIYRIPYIFIPMGLVNFNGTMPALWFDGLLLWAIFTHMNLRLHLGPLTRVIAGPQVHRIHHSNLEEHKDRNFGAFFPIWDQMFGTYHHPHKDEFPACGTIDNDQTKSMWQANFGVFLDWYRLIWPKPMAHAPAPAPVAVAVAPNASHHTPD